jgi:predicted transcriptional regulator
MSDQRDLFGHEEYPPQLYGGLPPHVDQDTSREAARAIKEDANTIRARIRELIGQSSGLTCDEVEMKTGLSHQTASARIRELALLGDIVDSSQRRPTRSGRKAIVWIIPR